VIELHGILDKPSALELQSAMSRRSKVWSLALSCSPAGGGNYHQKHKFQLGTKPPMSAVKTVLLPQVAPQLVEFYT
jgi:hypothetical protein